LKMCSLIKKPRNIFQRVALLHILKKRLKKRYDRANKSRARVVRIEKIPAHGGKEPAARVARVARGGGPPHVGCSAYTLSGKQCTFHATHGNFCKKHANMT